LIVLREDSRGGGFHKDTTDANAYGCAAFANSGPVISTEFALNPGNRLDFIGSNTLPHDIPSLSPLRIMMPPYSTILWKENGGREIKKNGKRKTNTIFVHASPPNRRKLPEFEPEVLKNIQEDFEIDDKLTPIQVAAAMKLSNKDKEARISHEATVDNLDNRPQFVFSEVRRYDPDFFEAERVKELSIERQNSLYGNEFLKHIEEISPTDFFPSYYTDSTLTIIIEGVKIPEESPLHEMIVTAMKMGADMYELSKKTTKNVNINALFGLFTDDNIIQTRKEAEDEVSSKKSYKRLKGGKSLKKKRRTKKR
jgi:hypothetical protein